MNQRIYHKATLPNNEILHYQEANPESEMSEAIVLIHGNNSAQFWWDDIIDGLQPLGYRIIAMDLRGFGQSTYHTPCNRFKDWAEDVIELCKLLKIQKAIVNGWSFGGAIAQKVAQMAPELVVKLILTASGPHSGLEQLYVNEKGEPRKTKEELLEHPKVAGTIQIIKGQNREMMKQIFQQVFYGKMESYPQQKKQKLETAPFMQRNHLDLFQSLVNSDIEVQKIKAKTLTIHGKEDSLITLTMITKTAEILGKFEVWENGGHMLPVEDTPRYLKSIIEFIKQ